MAIKVIDLFAGPGGLGEGFSSLLDDNRQRIFDIRLSIEKDKFAHQTLLFRSFFRQFPPGKVPVEYYETIRENDKQQQQIKKQELFDKFPEEYKTAQQEAWCCELGSRDFPPETIDRRIREALDRDNNWILIGGPPCQAFSMAGRSRVGGISESDHRVFLYKEYLRIIAVHQPSIFVMENVRGLLSAKLNGESIFQMIKKDLHSPAEIFTQYPGGKKYRIYSFVTKPDGFDSNGNPIYNSDKSFLIKSEKYGIPQSRHRVILLGIKEGLTIKEPAIIPEVGHPVTVHDVINKLPMIRSGLSRRIVNTSVINNRKRHTYQRIINNSDIWAETLRRFRRDLNISYRIESLSLDTGANYIKTDVAFEKRGLKSWFNDPKLRGVCNHESRTHLESDIKRYLFASNFVIENDGRFPRMKDYPSKLLPQHRSAESGKFADRFRVQVPNKPATTITSHISKDGHYFIHYDPQQCRTLTVREAGRIQTFPDNYYFWGNRTQQYHQVGNAVPPLLARKLASTVESIMNSL